MKSQSNVTPGGFVCSGSMNTLKQNERVRLLPEFSDGLESETVFVCTRDEEKGRVDIYAECDLNLSVVPLETVQSFMVVRV